MAIPPVLVVMVVVVGPSPAMSRLNIDMPVMMITRAVVNHRRRTIGDRPMNDDRNGRIQNRRREHHTREGDWGQWR